MATAHATAALVANPVCNRHDNGPGHLECPERIAVLLEAVRSDPELAPCLAETLGRPATEEDLARVHTAEHLKGLRDLARAAEQDGKLVWIDPDTAVSPASFEAALAGAGCAITAAEAVLEGSFRSAFALCRPPGHHASSGAAMGFCLVNNVAIAARRVQAAGRAEKVFILDLDAHHGNGTQEIFYGDGATYVLSLHLWRGFPGTGAAVERGKGQGWGTTLNVPLPRKVSALDYRRRYLAALESALASFRPDMVFLSTGFDCLSGDPESELPLEPADLHQLISDLLERLPPGARGRVVGVLEGGYALERIGSGLVNVLRALTGLPVRA